MLPAGKVTLTPLLPDPTSPDPTSPLPSVPALSIEAFRRLKIFTTVYVVVWVLVIVFLWAYWFDLNVYVKWTLAVLEALFVPDFTSMRIIFENYSRYGERK
jgi:hypothetical protein